MSEDSTTSDAPAHGAACSHQVHVHYNYARGHEPPEQICIAAHVMRPGSLVELHMHSGDCVRCPNGHCHEPNVTLAFTDNGELMLTFENFPPPLHIEASDRGGLSHVITHQRPKAVATDGVEVTYEGNG